MQPQHVLIAMIVSHTRQYSSEIDTIDYPFPDLIDAVVAVE